MSLPTSSFFLGDFWYPLIFFVTQCTGAMLAPVYKHMILQRNCVSVKFLYLPFAWTPTLSWNVLEVGHTKYTKSCHCLHPLLVESTIQMLMSNNVIREKTMQRYWCRPCHVNVVHAMSLSLSPRTHINKRGHFYS